MCLKLFGKVLWIGTKLLIIVGTFMYFFDVGSDISFSVQLFNNCHVGYGAAAISIIVVAVIFSMVFPYVSSQVEENWGENCRSGMLGYLLTYLKLNWRELTNDDLDDEEKIYVHSVKFFESIIESVPQIGLSFYIIHHHGWDKSVLSDVEGDLQKLSLVSSIFSITISMATRRAWWKKRGKAPEKMDILVAFLWNFVPMTCFLVAYYIIMADSKWILIIYSCISPIACVAFLIMYFCFCFCFPCLEDWIIKSRFSINKFLLANTFIMACLHTIQIYAIGLEDPSLEVKPFNSCNSTDVENTASEDQLNFIHMHPEVFVTIIWIVVILALAHILIEMKFSTKREQSFFLMFISNPYLKGCDPDDDDKDKFQDNEDGKVIEKNHELKNLTNEETV